MKFKFLQKRKQCYLKIYTLLVLILSCVNLSLEAQQKVYPSKFTVALDGSADFVSIQDAINAVRDYSEQKVTILIKKGVYNEKILVPSRKRNIIFIGEDKAHTVITNNDYSGKLRTAPDEEKNPKYTTYTSYTLKIQGNDFSAQNLTIINGSGPVGQAVSVHVEADRVAFYNCNISGYQDTVYVAKDGTRNYFKACEISGSTDFIFGAATVIFEACDIVSLKNSYITAASTTNKEPFGLIFKDCTLKAKDSMVTQVYLGRPWRPHAKTIFINTFMDKHIQPLGWHNWGKIENEEFVFYAEYKSKGPGSSVEDRVSWCRQLHPSELKKYTIKNVFKDWKPSFNRK